MTWYEGGTYSSPCTAGGDLDLPDRLPVNEAVLNQTDKSLNKQLWALYPVELSSEAAMEQGAALHLSALESFDPACVPLDELSRRLGWQAADQRLQMMILDNITLEDLEAVGVYNCGPKSRRHSNFVNQLKKGVSLLLAMPKKLHHVVSVEEALAKVNSMMDDRHQSEAAKTLQPPLIWGLELRAVLSDLLELAPWHPFPDVMTAEQAFATGLAQMYTGLLYECALLSYRLVTTTADSGFAPSNSRPCSSRLVTSPTASSLWLSSCTMSPTSPSLLEDMMATCPISTGLPDLTSSPRAISSREWKQRLPNPTRGRMRTA